MFQFIAVYTVLVWASVVALIDAGERRSLPNQSLDITSIANIQIMPFLFLKLVSFDQYRLNLFTYDLTLILNVYFFSCVVITTGFVKFCVQSTTFWNLHKHQIGINLHSASYEYKIVFYCTWTMVSACIISPICIIGFVKII